MTRRLLLCTVALLALTLTGPVAAADRATAAPDGVTAIHAVSPFEADGLALSWELTSWQQWEAWLDVGGLNRDGETDPFAGVSTNLPLLGRLTGRVNAGGRVGGGYASRSGLFSYLAAAWEF